MTKIIFSLDVEPDISIYLKNSYLGISEGLPRVLDQFQIFNVKADFFITADVCLKYPEIINKIVQQGHNIGCHSYDHSIAYFGREKYEKQLDDITRATKVLKRITKCQPLMFRAPNFSINGGTIRVLEKSGYIIDSSILPGRKVIKWKIFTLMDYSNANTELYNPSYSDIRSSGDSKILEVPLTENPLSKGAPIGMGFLNYYGFEKTIEAINKSNKEHVIFLIHPWELIDLGKYYPNLRPWLHRACSGNHEPLKKLLEYSHKNYKISTIEDIVRNYRNSTPK